MAKILFLGLCAYAGGVALYYVLSDHLVGLFKSYVSIDNWTSGSHWQIFAILVSASLAIWQISNRIDESTKLQKMELLDKIQARMSLLKGMSSELEHDLNVYEQRITLHVALYRAGEALHYADYDVSMLSPNLANNTLEYDTRLINRLGNIYSFLKEANYVFGQARKPEMDKQARSRYYSQIFDQHQANLVEWRALIQDLRAYMNYYEPISVSIFNQTLKRGTLVIAFMKHPGNKLVLINAGGEGATDIRVRINFQDSPNEKKKFLVAFLAPRQPAEFQIDPPLNPENKYAGEGIVSYNSEHGDGVLKTTFKFVWNVEKQQWEDISYDKRERSGWGSYRVGHMAMDIPYSVGEVNNTNVIVELVKSSNSIQVINRGDSIIEWFNIIKDDGNVDAWKDLRFQYVLEPKEKLQIQLPTQSESDVFFVGKIVIKIEGREELQYMILSYRWDGKRKCWVGGHDA